MGADVSSEEPRQGIIDQLRSSLREGLAELQWREVLLFGVSAGVLMPLSFLQASALTFVAGIIPVGAGLLLGRRVKGHYTLHGFVTGLIGALVGLMVLAGLIFFTSMGTAAQVNLSGNPGALPVTPLELWLQLGGFIAFSLLAFCTFGASTAGRAEQRNRQSREVVSERGGRLEKPSAIRTADDIRGLSLPQFGTYVNNLFKKKGFQFKDYKFVDKDKHLDMWFEYEGQPWRVRLTVADKVSPGTVEGLLQEMKREGVRKGVVVTSTEFTPGSAKSAKGRPVVLIDGATLYEIAEK
jgi:Restriction endonuclease